MRGSIHCPTKFSQSDTHIHTLPIKCACHVSPLQSRATSHTIVRVCMCKCIIQTVSFVVEVGSKSAVFLKLEGSMWSKLEHKHPLHTCIAAAHLKTHWCFSRDKATPPPLSRSLLLLLLGNCSVELVSRGGISSHALQRRNLRYMLHIHWYPYHLCICACWRCAGVQRQKKKRHIAQIRTAWKPISARKIKKI